MTTFAKFMTVFAVGSVIATLVAPKAQTAQIAGVNWKGLTSFAKVTQGRG